MKQHDYECGIACKQNIKPIANECCTFLSNDAMLISMHLLLKAACAVAEWELAWASKTFEITSMWHSREHTWKLKCVNTPIGTWLLVIKFYMVRGFANLLVVLHPIVAPSVVHDSMVTKVRLHQTLQGEIAIGNPAWWRRVIQVTWGVCACKLLINSGTCSVDTRNNWTPCSLPRRTEKCYVSCRVRIAPVCGVHRPDGEHNTSNS